jgi:diguanylate cyclase (GGDEF)-like protein
MAEPARRRIVVVEDDVATQRLLQRQLENAGYQVAAFDDGRTALDRIRESGAGIVITDWSMPGLDGLELCRALRELEGLQALGSTYIILLTAHDAKEQVIAGLQAGANDYLIKPYHPGELLARIQVGDRILQLQEELLGRTLELHKANAQMALLAGKLEHLANTDVLTGLGNRRRLLERLGEAWDAAERSGEPLSAIMLDLDYFKRVNDTYGHAAGDDVLRYVAGVIRRSVRRPELCGRFGGEEFLLIYTAMTADQAAALAEKIRSDVRGRRVMIQDAPIDVSVSGGVAQKGRYAASPEELIRRADAMLYAAKEHGRNQTWVLSADGREYRADAPPQTTQVAAAGLEPASDVASPRC